MGADLLDLLMRLVTTYRDQLMDGGDSKARRVFGKSEYAVPLAVGLPSHLIQKSRIFLYQSNVAIGTFLGINQVLTLFAVGDVYVSLCKKSAYDPFSARRKS